MLNVAVIMGRLTADPELRHTPNDIAVTSFTVAVDRGYVKQGAERQADFIDVVAWRGTAEFVSRYFRKGSMIAVQGSIQTRSYTDNQGVRRKAVEIVADNVSFTGSKSETSGMDNSSRFDSLITEGPSYANADNGDFEEIETDDELPF